ncbi:MAG: manganese efflux pump, partial [Clostridia bacterium]|nr:manganese efflux pump [Clostridia bacterium]
GITFALYPDINILPSISIIGIVTFVICAGGVVIGHKFGAKFKSKAELLGGIVLVIIGLKLLIEGLLEGIVK